MAFRGVPFARLPVSAMRGGAPQPVIPWAGVRDASVSGPAPTRTFPCNADAVKVATEGLDPGVPGIMAWPDYVGQTSAQPRVSEDCLFVDICTPDPSARDLPVYVYYHGGANAGVGTPRQLEHRLVGNLRPVLHDDEKESR
jgi:para-nitrobenzyl esterase